MQVIGHTQCVSNDLIIICCVAVVLGRMLNPIPYGLTIAHSCPSLTSVTSGIAFHIQIAFASAYTLSNLLHAFRKSYLHSSDKFVVICPHHIQETKLHRAEQNVIRIAWIIDRTQDFDKPTAWSKSV